MLLKDTGKYLLEHTYEQVCKAGKVDGVIIAADDERIQTACVQFGARCIMTSKSHKSGTDRIAEAVKDIQTDIIINVQADEPEISPESIDLLADLMLKDDKADMATLVSGFKDVKDIANPDIVKCIVDKDGYAIYFSRLAIPYSRDNKGVGDVGLYLRHLGIYAYRRSFLMEFTKLPEARLESAEKLEQLRAIENGYKILTAKVSHHCDGIDTRAQYDAFVERKKKELK